MMRTVLVTVATSLLNNAGKSIGHKSRMSETMPKLGYDGFNSRIISDFTELGEMSGTYLGNKQNPSNFTFIRPYLCFLVRAFIARRPREQPQTQWL